MEDNIPPSIIILFKFLRNNSVPPINIKYKYNNGQKMYTVVVLIAPGPSFNNPNKKKKKEAEIFTINKTKTLFEIVILVKFVYKMLDKKSSTSNDPLNS